MYMTMNRIITSVVIASASMLITASPAFADDYSSSSPLRDDSPSVTVTVDGTDYPVCAEEDCSDQVGQVGVWTSKRTGLSYLELGEGITYPIIDNTGECGFDCGYDAGYEN